MKKRQKLLLALVSGIMLWLAWPPISFFPLLFVGFVPILWLEEEISASPKSAKYFFGYAYLGLLIWNVCTTWWVGNTYQGTGDISTLFAGIFANTANPLLMCIPLIGFHRTKKRLGETWGYLSLIAYWITFEFFHLRWELSWPWLTLGNGFAGTPSIIQWYSVIGTLGGSVWILAANIFAYKILRVYLTGRIYLPYKKYILQFSLVVFIPIVVSLMMYYTYQEKGEAKEVVCIQPNIDPYNEKFDLSTLDKQLQIFLDLSKAKITQQTDYLVWPETALPQGIWINELHEDVTIEKIKFFFKDYPRLKIVTGINGYEEYDSQKTATARYSKSGGFYYDAYNTAIQIDSTSNIPYYNKSKLVPGVERMPYPQFFKFIEPLVLNMGGISGSLGMQKYRVDFFGSDSIGIAPMICYESIYGEYSNEYIQRGANLLFVITNDGWWGNTAGHKQHLDYGRLRCIETRRDLAQSANTGTSAFINQRGDVSHTTQWWVPAAISATLYANNTETFYVRFGDYIGRICVAITICFLIVSVVMHFRKRKTD